MGMNQKFSKVKPKNNCTIDYKVALQFTGKFGFLDMVYIAVLRKKQCLQTLISIANSVCEASNFSIVCDKRVK